MASGQYADNGADGISGFGGHLLAPMGIADSAAAPEANLAGLAALGIEDAEQLVAIAAIPDIAAELGSALSVTVGDLQRLVDDAAAALPRERAALVSSPAPPDRSLGVLMPTDDMIAAAEATAMEIAAAPPLGLPASVNLISFMPPIRNQGSRGTCVAFTCTALNEYILRRRGNAQDLSEQHLYYETKLIDGSPGACGTWQAKAVIVLRDRGECREVVWPYNPNPPCNNNGTLPSQARPDALAYRLATLAVSTRNVQEYKTHMSKQRPVTLSIPVYDSWYRSAETQRSGRITMRVGNEQATGGHAVCLVGYQDQASSPGGGYFIVRNHWSTNWASQSPYGAGYGTIPYQYITNDAWEAFTAVVPGVGEDGDGDTHEVKTGTQSIVIEVGSNTKITISTD
ncbi:MAG TPA: C1 family peptidase [Pseudonocardiaceae bacterium]|nr:C1 family peptidase [Pseudonocardiaceae bacterium]